MEHISIAPKIVFTILGWPISNSILATWAAMLVLIIIALIVKLTLKYRPTGLQNFMEFVIESLLGLVDSVTGNRELSKKIFPWIATFFLIILLTNWMELIPGFATIGLLENGHFIPILRSANTDLNTTLSYALISVVMVQIIGMSSVGFFQHVGKFINFKSGVGFFVGILEIISEIAKVMSFTFRLFGNIFAGEVLLVVISFLIPYIIPLPFYGLELFVGFIQALVFAMLTLVFMTMAATKAEH